MNTTGILSLVRFIFWLKKTDWGLSFLLALASFIGVVYMAVRYPAGLFETIFLEGPVFDVGVSVGTIVFPNYRTRGTNGFYLVPLFGAASDFIVLMVLWFIGIQAIRWLRTEKHDGNHQQL
ncbi:MAG: hypothetical protein WA254_01150 [Candidatus Sulfotelmatobacter sp.]